MFQVFRMTLEVGCARGEAEDGGGTEGKWLVLPARVKTLTHTELCLVKTLTHRTNVCFAPP